MPKLPPAKTCLFAEQIRPELNGKFSILGFYGIAPDVSIYVESVPAFLPLAAMLICEKSLQPGEFNIELEITGPEGQTIVNKVGIQGIIAKVGLGASTFCNINIQGLAMPVVGRYAINLWSEGEMHSTTTFECRMGKFVNGILEMPI